jgi:hypothetical protein
MTAGNPPTITSYTTKCDLTISQPFIWERNPWTALSHSRGHWLVRHCSALFKAAFGRQ